MKDIIYKYIYKASMGVMVISAVLLLFVTGTAPYGLSASWGKGDLGSSLVFTRPEATATIGQKVVALGKQQGEVSMYVVEEVLRREGVVYYRVSDFQGSDLATLPASQLGRAVVLDIPSVGVFARMLTHFLGVMTLIGLPLLMLIVNYVLSLLQRIIPIISSLEKSAQKNIYTKRRVVYKEKEERRKEARREDTYVTVLKPYDLRGTYGH